MKHNLYSLCPLLVLLLLLTSSYAFARSLASKQGKELMSMDDARGEYLEQMGGADSFSKLMGLEKCENGDEECLKRRLIAEAHLDYIYTQHHKP